MLDGFTNLCFDVFTAARIASPRVIDDTVEVVLGRGWKRKGRGRKGGDFFAVDDHGNDEVTVVHLDEVGLVEDWLELFGEDGGVVGGDAERDGRADIAEDGVAD